MTGAEALRKAVARLKEAGIDDPARDARRLLAHALDIAPDRVTLVLPDVISDAQQDSFSRLIRRRAAREPVSHLTGRRSFYGRDFLVTRDVLDPRPETETLVEQALAQNFSTLLDLGVGSGCILLTLLAERPKAAGLGTDLSAAALEVARRNATQLNLRDRADFKQGAWFDAVPDKARFDLIVSNPPYIARDEMDRLSPELSHEPRMALTDEYDGLGAYHVIARDAPRHLTPGGQLMVEIGPTQAQAVTDLFLAAGLETPAVHTDLDGRDRVVSGVFPPRTDL
jgi:release factor glutamine methyltransferase